MRTGVLLAAALSVLGCAGRNGVDPAAVVEARSLLGRDLVAPEPEAEFRARQEALLAEASERLRRDPGDLDARIWVGRRTAYLGRYREAIQIYSEGVARDPREPDSCAIAGIGT